MSRKFIDRLQPGGKKLTTLITATKSGSLHEDRGGQSPQASDYTIFLKDLTKIEIILKPHWVLTNRLSYHYSSKWIEEIKDGRLYIGFQM